MWSTSDGVAVVHASGQAGGTLRRRRISQLQWSEVPGDIPSLAELYDSCGPELCLAAHVADDRSAAGAIRSAEEVSAKALGGLWLINPDIDVLAVWRQRWSDVHLVNETKLSVLRRGAERRAAELAATRVQAVALPPGEWSGGLTTLFHRFGCYTFALDVQHERVVRQLLRMGIDAVSSAFADRMVAARDGRPGPAPA